MSNWLDEIKWDSNGLIPAIAQDYKTERILMMAWLNREALELTVKEQRAIYWSRSRAKLWRKGEESGHIQKLHELRLDCDADDVAAHVNGQVRHVGHIVPDNEQVGMLGLQLGIDLANDIHDFGNDRTHQIQRPLLQRLAQNRFIW